MTYVKPTHTHLYMIQIYRDRDRELWLPSHPNLYTVAVSLADATTARVIDDVRRTHTHIYIYIHESF
jgi:hypothetical protein